VSHPIEARYDKRLWDAVLVDVRQLIEGWVESGFYPFEAIVENASEYVQKEYYFEANDARIAKLAHHLARITTQSFARRDSLPDE
jgi:hypothetical protein